MKSKMPYDEYSDLDLPSDHADSDTRITCVVHDANDDYKKHLSFSLPASALCRSVVAHIATRLSCSSSEVDVFYDKSGSEVCLNNTGDQQLCEILQDIDQMSCKLHAIMNGYSNSAKKEELSQDIDGAFCHENLKVVVDSNGRTVRFPSHEKDSATSEGGDVNQSCPSFQTSPLQSDYESQTSSGPLSSARTGSSYKGYSLATAFTKSATGYVGLVNQAMTCYLNSLLQTLFMTPEFCNAIYRWQYTGSEEEGVKSIPYQLQRLFLKLQTSQRRSIETTHITRSFGWDSSEAWQQHDVQELCHAMFDALEKTWENTSQANLINELYEGKMKDCVQCLECGFESARTTSYVDIQLPVRPFGATNKAYGSVTEALKAFCAPEVLNGNNQFNCEQCKTKRDAHKSLKFLTFPYLLTIHLLRFDFDYSTLRRIKLNHKITFPDILDLNEFVTPQHPQLSTGEDALLGASSDQIGDSHGVLEYELFSIMVHSGNATGGHYYAYIKSFETGQWYSFNDQLVTPITDEDISKTYGGVTDTGSTGYCASAYASSTNAYMLMYRLIDKQRNARRMTPEEYPPHLKNELQKLQDLESAERHLQDVERNTCKIKLFVFHPSLLKMVESTLVVDMNATLAQATETAWKLCMLESTVPLNCVRLVKYDALHDYIDRSFDGEENSPMHQILGGVRFVYSFDLLLEIKQPEQIFAVYRTGGVSVKVFVVDLDAEAISSPITIRMYLQQTVAALKSQIADHLPCDSDNLRCVLDVHSDLRLLTDAERTLKVAGFGKNNKVFVECSGSETDSGDFTNTRLYQLLDRFDNTIHIRVHLPPLSDIMTEDVNSLSAHLDAVTRFESEGAKLQTNDGYINTDPSQKPLAAVIAAAAAAIGQTEMSTDGDAVDAKESVNDVAMDISGTGLWTHDATDSGGIWKQIDARPSVNCVLSSDRYIKHFRACYVDGADAKQRSLMVTFDKRITVKALKKCLQTYVGVTADNFDIYRILSNGDELEMKRMYETMSLYDDNSDFRVKLGRPVKSGEYRLNVYQFIPTDKKPVKFLSEAVVAKGMSVMQLKQSILEDLSAKQPFTDLPLDRCRLRKKSFKTPGTIYSDGQVFDDSGINLTSNMDIFLEVLNEPDKLRVQNDNEMSVYVRLWSPSRYHLDSVIEVIVDEESPVDLISKFSKACNITEENLQFAKMPGTFPCDISVFDVHTSLPWLPVDGAPCCLKSLGVYSDGAVFCCRDKTEQLKELGAEERKQMEQAENSRFLMSTSYGARSVQKERALKIYTSDNKSP